mgnify:CR=1 FL=1
MLRNCYLIWLQLNSLFSRFIAYFLRWWFVVWLRGRLGLILNFGMFAGSFGRVWVAGGCWGLLPLVWGLGCFLWFGSGFLPSFRWLLPLVAGKFIRICKRV